MGMSMILLSDAVTESYVVTFLEAYMIAYTQQPLLMLGSQSCYDGVTLIRPLPILQGFCVYFISFYSVSFLFANYLNRL